MKQELDAARELALRAGNILLDHYSRPSTTYWKGPDDPVTDADRAASHFLTQELERRFPQDGVLSEETPDDAIRLTKSRVWIVDPMDGTKEFVSHCDEFAVMIGLAVDGVARLGVVCQPVTGKIYYAAAGMGAFLSQDGNEVRLQASAEANPSEMTIALSRSHPSATVEQIRQRLGIGGMTRSGSLGLKVGMICEGRSHLYVTTSSRTFQWDTCAPEAILLEAGGRLTDLSNNTFLYNRPDLRNPNGVIASSGPIHDRICDAAQAVLNERG